MKTTLFGITWAAAHFFTLFPVLVSVLLLVVYAIYRRFKFARLLAAPQWRSVLVLNFSQPRLIAKTVLLIAGSLFLFLALLRPQWGTKEKVVEQEGRELFVALDVSRSMLASDIKPNRLAFAKAKIKQLLQLLPAERVALIAFSGTAVVQCPLTRDRALFYLFLDNLDAQTISAGTTALDQVIMKTVGLLKKLPTLKNKLLVIFTDGEDFSHDLAHVRQEAQDIGLRIFTYGVGTQEGAPIPILNDDGMPIGYEKNSQGNVILSRLNEPMLRALSEQTGASYQVPTQSNEDLRSLVQQVERYEKERFEDKELSTHEERYYYPLLGAFVCLLIEWLL